MSENESQKEASSAKSPPGEKSPEESTINDTEKLASPEPLDLTAEDKNVAMTVSHARGESIKRSSLMVPCLPPLFVVSR